MELPPNNADYREQWYWDKRFQTEDKYDWFSGYQSFQHLLKQDIQPSHTILTLGCGNSPLSEEMYNDGYRHITNTDFSSVVIQKMSEKHKELVEMTWKEMDICNLTYESETFDIVLEKGTLDALMVHEKDPWYVTAETCQKIDLILTQISKILKPGGKFISITFSQPHFRTPLYACTKYNWNVNMSTFGDSFSFFYFTMEKGKELSEKDKNLEKEYLDKRLNRDSSLKNKVYLDCDDQEDFMLGIDL